jgi:hypothetical protein
VILKLNTAAQINTKHLTLPYVPECRMMIVKNEPTNITCVPRENVFIQIYDDLPEMKRLIRKDISLLISYTYYTKNVSTYIPLPLSVTVSERLQCLVFCMLASGTQDHRFAPGRSRHIFFGRKNPQHAFLRMGSKAVCPMLHICGMSKNPIIYHGSHKL